VNNSLYHVEIRRVICSTNAIESLNARFRRAVRARGHFPNEQSAMKTLYLVVRSLDPKGTGQTRWVTRWKPALNAFAFTLRRPDAGGGEPLTMETPLTPLKRQSPPRVDTYLPGGCS
jgi:transposase-like protein